MKKLTLGAFMALWMAFAIPTQINASDPVPVTRIETTNAEAAQAQVLINRLYEIQKMDLNNLNRAEKKQLRKEVKGIRHDLKAISGGVYLSVTAIIIILLILILL